MTKQPEHTSNFTKIQKDKRVSAIIKRLSPIYKNMSAAKIETAKSLVAELAFMSVTLEDLKMTINKQGCVSFYQNGENQWGTKKSPEIEIYNVMIKNHMQVAKQLSEMLPDESKESAGAELLEFIGKK